MSHESPIMKIYRSSPMLQGVYRHLKGDVPPTTPDYTIPETTPVYPRSLDALGDEIRINLVIPSVNKKHVFGGISTALSFFNQLVDTTKIKSRIIITDAPIIPEESIDLGDYKIVSIDDDAVFDKQIVGVADRYNKTLAVGKNDIFITTGWWCSYCFFPIIKWQAGNYNTDLHKLIYFIQDYEPCFYAWSSRYLMADSTYKSDVPTIAIFNSKLLKEYFDINGYKFVDSYYFEPVLNQGLKKVLLSRDETLKRKKQIIVYGRPSVQRNAFELVVASLKNFVENKDDVEEWSFLSLGESHTPVDLGKGKQLVSSGKLSIEEYANTMLETYMALSLMVSPHPSYPPLEMATFGIKTITNTYCNKDLTSFSKNIISVSNSSADNIGAKLLELSEKFDPSGQPDINDEYVNNVNIFSDIIDSLYKKHLS